MVLSMNRVILEKLLQVADKDEIDYPAIEKADERGNGEPYRREYAGFTPLMLGIANGSMSHYLVIQLMMSGKASLHCKDKDGNNLLHIAVRYDNPQALKAILDHMQTDRLVFTRNRFG